VPEAETSELIAGEAPLSARDILRWAEGKLPDAVVSGAILYYAYGKGPSDVAKGEHELRPEPLPTPEQRGRALRRIALEHCPAASAEECLEGLDRARALDPDPSALPKPQKVPSAVTKPNPRLDSSDSPAAPPRRAPRDDSSL